MLVKKFKIIKQYTTGFEDGQSEIIATLYDVDRQKNIVSGNWVSEKMERYIQGVELGLNMAGYMVAFDQTEEIDMVTNKTRKLNK